MDFINISKPIKQNVKIRLNNNGKIIIINTALSKFAIEYHFKCKVIKFINPFI